MTVPYCAVKAGRRGVGVELNPRYFADGVAYVASAATELSTGAVRPAQRGPGDQEAS